MILLLTQAFRAPGIWLWLAATAIAVIFLGSAAGRRRTSLIETLREFVRGPEKDADDSDVDTTDGDDTNAAN